MVEAGRKETLPVPKGGKTYHVSQYLLAGVWKIYNFNTILDAMSQSTFPIY
jgi:hypothetical protein